jgi:hypothetical protein
VCIRHREIGCTRLRFWADGNEHVLAPVLAENRLRSNPCRIHRTTPIFVEEQLLVRYLRPGERARVVGLSPACRGAGAPPPARSGLRGGHARWKSTW